MANSSATQRFYELVWPHRAVVLRAARIQTGNLAEAEDLAQETLFRAFRSIGSFRSRVNAKAWLMTILRNARIDRLRTLSGSPKHLSLDDLATVPVGVPQLAVDRESVWRDPQALLADFSDETIIDALQNVSEELRWTLLLVDVEGLDHADAASILEVPVGTIKSRMHRARAALREALMPLARDRRVVSG